MISSASIMIRMSCFSRKKLLIGWNIHLWCAGGRTRFVQTPLENKKSIKKRLILQPHLLKLLLHELIIRHSLSFSKIIIIIMHICVVNLDLLLFLSLATTNPFRYKFPDQIKNNSTYIIVHINIGWNVSDSKKRRMPPKGKKASKEKKPKISYYEVITAYK